MNPAELTGSLAVLGLTKSGAARLFGVTYRTVHRWTEGEQEIPRAVAIALRLMIRFGVKPEDVVGTSVGAGGGAKPKALDE